MNISQATKSFFQKNLAAGDDFGKVKEGREEAKRVDTELERIHTDSVDVRSSLETLKEDSQLKPPSFANVSNKQVLIGAASAGAVVGGAIGVISNITSGGEGAVNITERTVDVFEPKLDGHGFKSVNYTVGGTPQNPDGWDVEMTRSAIVNEKVGEYTERTAVSSGAGNIAVSGLIGAGVGAGVGALAGGAVTLLRKTSLMDEYNGTPARETEGDAKLMIAGGVAGAAIGAGAGALSSLLNSTTKSYETEFVNMETEVIGQVPKGDVFYVPNDGSNQPPANTEAVADLMNGNIDKLARKGWVQTDHLRPQDVEAQVPEKTLIGGNVKIRTEDKEITVGASMIGSIVGGAAVGAVTGIAGGILVNVLRKTL
jgi:hypothetical protein